MNAKPSRHFENQLAWAWALLVLVSGLLISTTLYLGLQKRQLEAFQNRIDESAAQFIEQLRARLDNYGPALVAARALFVSAERSQITARSFQDFSESLQTLEEMHAPGGLGYAARIPADRFKAYAERLRSAPTGRYQVQSTPSGTQDRLIIEFFEPEFINARYLGVDLASKEQAKQAALLAIARDQAVMSEPEVQLDTATPGIWTNILLPVFPRASILTTSDQRLAAYTGLVFVTINLEPILDELTQEASGLQISLKASKAREPFFTTPTIYPTSDLAKPFRGDFNIYGSQWSIRIAADTSLTYQPSALETWSPVLGAALSSLLASYLVGVGISNISRKRQAALVQARLAAIVESVDECIISEDLKGNITSWNGSAQTLFGRRGDEVLGHQAIKIMDLEFRAAGDEDAVVAASLAGRGGPQSCTRTKADGSRQSLLMSVSEIHDDLDQLVGYARVIRDVTQQELLEAELRESQKMQAVGLLTGGLAHDFNNLLGIVVGNLDELEKRVGQSESGVKLHLAAAQDAAARGSQVAQSLLGIARQQNLDITTRDINKLLKELLPLLESSIGATVTLQLQLIDTPLEARLDVSRFSNAVLNLVINARDAVNDGTGPKAITVRTAVVSGQSSSLVTGLEKREHALVSVEDTGIGMTAEVRRRAFEPFYTTKKVGEGTGLGLPTVLGFAQQLGGTVTLNNTSGSGLVVNLYLPLQAPSQNNESETKTVPSPGNMARSAPPTAVGSPPFAHESVLIVDDEIELVQLAGRWFEELGYKVRTANSPKEAKYMLGLERINLLFTDVLMPGSESGVDLAYWARKRHPDIRILFASGYAPELAESSAMLGPLLQKPYRKKDLASLLANWPAAHLPKGSSS